MDWQQNQSVVRFILNLKLKKTMAMKIMNKESRRKENDDNAEDYESEMNIVRWLRDEIGM